MKNLKKYSALVISLNLLIVTDIAMADTININNNPAPQAPVQAENPPANAASAQQSSSNVLPEGTYRYQNSDGSGEQVYTTGEKKPYIVDSGSNNNNAPPVVQPYVNYGNGPGPAPAPLPRR